MFIGHFGVGFGAKAAEPKISLGTYFLAAQFLDLLWPILILIGVEKVEIKPGITKVAPLDFTYYPISHSLLMVLIWALAFGFVSWLFRKNIKASIILGACVLSHWILDLIVHRPDLPLYPGSTEKFGLGLWNSLSATLIVECVFFFGGLMLYWRVTKAINKIGFYGFWLLAALLLVIYIASTFGPPPTSVSAIGWTAQLQWIFILFAYWIDRNRVPRVLEI
jgi:hypothetical protein